MAGGFLMGLGQGLQGFGNAMAQVPIQQHEAKRQAMLLALQQRQQESTDANAKAQLAIQAEAQKRLAQQMAQEQARWTVDRAPEGTAYTPETRQQLEGAGMQPFIRPDIAFSPEQVPVTTGLPPQWGGTSVTPQQAPGSYDTGRGYAIPTEDARMRTAMMNNQARQNLQGDRLSNALALQRMRAEAAQEIERLRQLDPARNAQAAAALKQAEAAFQRIDLAWQQEMRAARFQEEVTTPDILEDNARAAFIANNPTGGDVQWIPDPTSPLGMKPVVQPRTRPVPFVPPKK